MKRLFSLFPVSFLLSRVSSLIIYNCSTGDDITQYSRIPEIPDLEKLHQDLHALAQKIVEMKKKENSILARKEIAQLE